MEERMIENNDESLMIFLYLCTTAHISRDEIDRLYIAVEKNVVLMTRCVFFLGHLTSVQIPSLWWLGAGAGAPYAGAAGAEYELPPWWAPWSAWWAW